MLSKVYILILECIKIQFNYSFLGKANESHISPSMACESRLNEVVHTSDPSPSLILEPKPWSALEII